MSQRLMVGYRENISIYDCVLLSLDGAHERLRLEWLRDHDGFFLGPWKIRIVDLDLWRQVDPIVASLFQERGVEYPECIWTFYCGHDCIVHPTRAELDAWVEHMAARGREEA